MCDIKCAKAATSRYVGQKIHQVLDAENNTYRPRVIILACGRRHFRGDDLRAMKRLSGFADFRTIVVPCSQEVDPNWIRTAFKEGADGVIVLGSHPTKCRFAENSGKLQEASGLIESAAAEEGKFIERILVDWRTNIYSNGLDERIERFIEAIS